MSRHLLIPTTLLAIGTGALQARADPIPLQLFEDVTVSRTDNGDGTIGIGISGNGDRVDASNFAPTEERAVLRFIDLAGVTGQTLESATLRLDISFVNYQLLTDDATLSVYGFNPDNTLSSADFGKTSTLLGVSDVIGTTGQIDISLDAALVQSILLQGFSDDLGLVIQQNAAGRSVGFWSTEGAQGLLTVSPAQLLVTVPEPASAAMLALAGAALMRRRPQ